MTNKSSGSPCNPTKANAEKIKIFPASNAWNTNISKNAVDPDSDQIISAFATDTLRIDLSIPYVVVCGNEPKINIRFLDAPDESDPGPYPIPLNAPIEGNGEGDSHVISVDIENRMLYELFKAKVDGDGWLASCGAIFNLKSNKLRPDNWVSADAAGLPIFPGLIRYEEILTRKIDHAIRFTLKNTMIKPAHIEPARHHINVSSGGISTLPFGGRIRLKANYNIKKFSATNKIILKAMKKYGLILADSGANLFITGASDERWDDDLQNLRQIKGSDFEVVKIK